MKLLSLLFVTALALLLGACQTTSGHQCCASKKACMHPAKKAR